MKYFTPELINRLNSKYDPVVETAEHDWVIACEAYERGLKIIRPLLSGTARAVLDLNLHDRYRLSPMTVHDDTLLICLRQGSNNVKLKYFLREKPVIIVHELIVNASQWAYDEIHFYNTFVHNILWSNGTEWQIPFNDIAIVDELHEGKLRTVGNEY